MTDMRLARSFALGLALCLCAVLSAFLLYLQPGSEIVPGLDASWAYGLSYAHEKGIVMGRDVIFTFGPLGFLQYTDHLSDEIIITSSLFWFTVSCVLFLVLSRVIFEKRSHFFIKITDAVLLLSLYIFANSHESRLMLIIYASVILHALSRKTFYLCMAATVSSIAMCIKFSYGVASLALLFPYAAYVAFSDRSFRALLLVVCCVVLTCCGIWLVSYGSLEGIVGYLRGGLEFSRGSTSAMARNPANEWFSVANFYAATLVAMVLSVKWNKSRYRFSPLFFIFPLFIWTRYAFGREDPPHLAAIMYFVFFVFGMFAVLVDGFLKKTGMLFLLLTCYVSWRGMHVHIGNPEFNVKPQVFGFSTFAGRLNPQKLIPIWEVGTRKALNALQIPQTMRDAVAEKSVDIYPWESVIAEANHLNWTPRPIFQNYISYTPFLDGKNKDFFEDDKRAPDFVLWHFHAYQDIADRYPFSTDPLTLDAIFRRYQLSFCESSFCLFERKHGEKLSTSSASIGYQTAQWNEWIPVPTYEGDYLRAKIQVSRTVPGKLSLAFWKEGAVYVDYRFRSGEVRTHDLLIDNATSGIWASPYISSLSGRIPEAQPLSTEELENISRLPVAEGYIDRVAEGAQGPVISGWGFVPFMDTTRQTVWAVFFNEKRAYKAELESRLRPGIAGNYPEHKATVNLNKSGFVAEINAKSMEPDIYKVRFLIENNGSRVFSPENGLNVEVASGGIHTGNIDAIRVRSLRDWVFEPDISIEWVSTDFSGKAPF